MRNLTFYRQFGSHFMIPNAPTLWFKLQILVSILAGNSGTGKIRIAKALLLIGCQENFRCRYTTATTMLQKMLSGLADQSLEAKFKRYLAPEVLLIDELGFDRLEQHEAKHANLFHTSRNS